MSGFLTQKIITIETLGERLKKVREGKNLTLEEAAKKLNIQEKYLFALEKGDYHGIPGEIYVKNFISVYSKFLGLNPDLSIKLYKKEKYPFKQKLFLNHFGKKIVISQIFKKVFQIAAILFILFYLGLGIKKNIFPPFLTIISPPDNLIVRDGSIAIIGQTEEGAFVKINDKLADSNVKGKFEETVELKSGLNIIKISSSRKRGGERTAIRKVIFNKSK